MIHIAWPWIALLLPLPWLLYHVRRAAEPGGSALFVPFAAAFVTASAGNAAISRAGRFAFIAVWLLLVLAAMRPQWLGDPMPAPTTGRRVLLAIDVSGSMATQDMEGDLTRLQVVQQVAGRFIERRRGDQVGLILFGTQPYLQAPLTTDLATVRRFLDEAVVGVAGTETAIGDAIGLAIKRLRAARTDAGKAKASRQTVLVLLTDGQNDAGAMSPAGAARLAAQTGLRIYTIGVGDTDNQGLFALAGAAGPDEHTLREVARATGGQYFRATDASALEAIYRKIDELEPAAARAQWLRPATEWFTWPLALALVLSVPAVAAHRSVWA